MLTPAPREPLNDSSVLLKNIPALEGIHGYACVWVLFHH